MENFLFFGGVALVIFACYAGAALHDHVNNKNKKK
jgi:hypothetical protein